MNYDKFSNKDEQCNSFDGLLMTFWEKTKCLGEYPEEYLEDYSRSVDGGGVPGVVTEVVENVLVVAPAETL